MMSHFIVPHDTSWYYSLFHCTFLGTKLSPQSLTAESYVTPHSIPVTWRPLNSALAVIQTVAYRVTYKAVSAGDEHVEGQSKSILVRGDTLSVTLTGLSSYTRYEIKVAALTRRLDRPAAVVYAGMYTTVKSPF